MRLSVQATKAYCAVVRSVIVFAFNKRAQDRSAPMSTSGAPAASAPTER